jgi:serine protease Do
VGSGVVIDRDRVATNAHNLRGSEVVVTFGDGRSETAAVLGADIDADLAVLDVATGDVDPLEPAAASPDIGSPVLALANPGGRGLRVTHGHVSGVERAFRGPRGLRISGSVEHTAPLLPGSSGGPIVDAGGRLLGINTHRLGEGFYLAMPADDGLMRRISALASGAGPTRYRLGVGLAPAEVARRLRRAVGLSDAEGLLVRHVEEGSPAEAAGLQEGDLVTHVGDGEVADVDNLHEILDQHDGSPLEVVLLRGADELHLSVSFD